MTIVANWYDWYGIEIREWLFLKSGEAKITINSHHASVNFLKKINFYYICNNKKIKSKNLIISKNLISKSLIIKI